MSDPRELRLARVREGIAALHLDGLLVTSLPNIRYLTGFSGSNALAVVTSHELLLLTDFRYAAQVKAEVGAFAEVRVEAASLWGRLWQWLARPGLHRLGFESAHLTHADTQRFVDAGRDWRWEPTVEVVESLRAQKDATEVARIQHAVRIAEAALQATLGEIGVGMTELEVAGRLERHLREAGSTWFPFETIVASGARAALPHARASAKPLARGELLLIDFGAIHDGYCSDITRTVCVGPAGEREREVHAIVRGATEGASAHVRAGMRGRDADALARDYIDRLGFGAQFGHSLGHGIGLEIHEAPRLAKTAEALLPTEAVVTVEPGIYIEGWGGVRIEDDVHLTSEGAAVLTSFTRELLEL
ncbi:MAG: aminopeptidase P family protein [Gemmatimonadaceae bacterium]|nr:aminopeptidase P family protein [Gemmatimonadaceae bacterium]